MTHPDLYVCAAAAHDPQTYFYVCRKGGDGFLTDPTANKIWAAISPESGLLDEDKLIPLFTTDQFERFESARGEEGITNRKNLDLRIDQSKRRFNRSMLDMVMEDFDTKTADEQLASVYSALDTINTLEHEDDDSAMYDSAMADFDRRIRGEPLKNVVGWPIPWMRTFSDLKSHEFVVIAARTSVGKTALGGQLAYEYAKAGKRVLFISTEMPRDEMTSRWCSYACGFGEQRLDKASMTGKKWTETWDGIWRMDNLMFQYESKFPKIMARIQQERANGLDMIFVDYLQRLHMPTGRNKIEEIAQAASAFKDIANDRCPVFAMAQLNREGDKDDAMPRISQIRGCGDIEQDADRVFLLHRPKGNEKTTPKEIQEIQLIQAKNRNGMRTSTTVYLHGETFSMSAQNRWAQTPSC